MCTGVNIDYNCNTISIAKTKDKYIDQDKDKEKTNFLYFILCQQHRVCQMDVTNDIKFG